MTEPSLSTETGPRAPLARVGGFSGSTLALTGVASFLTGMIIGVSLMWLVRGGPRTTDTASTASSASAEPGPSASQPAPSVSAPAPKPTVDPAQAAQAAKLAELKKKVKSTRSSKLDSQCARFTEGFKKGYVFDGGTFAENEYVANAAGCVAVAKTSKAPWFCCKK